jgi:hypothetical protein
MIRQGEVASPQGAVALHLFNAIGFEDGSGFLVYFAITLLFVIHDGADYLYSKYSESSYAFANFASDTVLSFLLVAAYVTFSSNAARGIQDVRLGFTMVWVSLTVTYVLPSLSASFRARRYRR